MVKIKESKDDTAEAAETRTTYGTVNVTGKDEELKRAGGRTTARWKQQAFAELAEGDDQTVASRLNQIAHEEGYDYHCTPAAVARWRQAEASSHLNGVVPSGEQEDGYAIVVLRQLVHLPGKEAVKKLIDSL